jgi:multiple sugar transport system permease protein
MRIDKEVTYYKSRRKREIYLKLIAYIFLIALSGIFAFPLFWMISTSLKPETQVFVFPPQLIPRPVIWKNYIKVLPLMRFRITLLNTLLIVAGNVAGSLFSSSLVAYSFARLRWPGRDLFFVILLSTMMIPYIVTMIPIFVVFNRLGWVNTFKPLIVPSFFGSPFYIFLARQFFRTIPNDLSDAAKIDGCSEFGIYLNIILPLCKPILAVIGIFSFMGAWNDFLGPLIYLNNEDKWPLSLMLYAMRSAQAWQLSWPLLMAGSTIMTLPVIIIFFFTQKTFIQSITLTGIKG